MYETAIGAFVILFVIIDPIGTMPIFMALTRGSSNKYRHAMAIKGPMVAMLILTIFAFFGADMLSALGISMSAFKIAGGFMLAVTAFEMVFEKRNNRKSKNAEKLVKIADPDDISVCPIAIPLLAGPGSVTTVMLLIDKYQGEFISQFIVIGALIAVLVICIISYLFSSSMERFIGQTLSSIITRLLGIILAALSVQFMADGLKSIFA